MDNNAHILIVEDDVKIAALLADYFVAAGLRVTRVADGLAAVEAVRAHAPDLMVLDLMLPSLDGVGVCSAVRAFSALPIIMLTARVDEIDRLLGLESGADDYVCKPFSPREVVARVRAHLRRAAGMGQLAAGALTSAAAAAARTTTSATTTTARSIPTSRISAANWPRACRSLTACSPCTASVTASNCRPGRWRALPHKRRRMLILQDGGRHA